MNDIEKLARRIDPMAWNSHALSTSGGTFQMTLKIRRDISLKQAEREAIERKNQVG